MRRVSRWSAIAKWLAVALAIGAALVFVTGSLNVSTADGEAYWRAALRLRGGAPLYFQAANSGDPLLYWYAPWFAAAWVPLTYLPHGAVLKAWTLLLAAAFGYLCWPLIRRPSAAGVALFALAGISLTRTVLIGNVQPLMLAAVAWGLHRRSGPFVIAAAASLKIFPVLFALVYVRQRDWGRLAVTLAVTALLWLPALFFDLSRYPVASINPPLALPLILAIAVAAGLLAVRPGRYADLALAVAVMCAGPRWYHYTPAYLLLGVPREPSVAPVDRGPASMENGVRH